MSLVEFNVYWMIYNVSLAVIAVVCGWSALNAKSKILRIILLILWLLFMPNTLYLLSDTIHFSQQLLQVAVHDRINLFLEYMVVVIFGIISYVTAMYPIERLLKNLPMQITNQEQKISIIYIQFVIAFGIVMGRVERTHSWEVFSNPQKVVHDTLAVISSPTLILFVVITGIVGNIVYFSLKSIFIRYVVRK